MSIIPQNESREKICRTCKQRKSLTEFYVNTRYKTPTADCKECYLSRAKEKRLEKKEKIKSLNPGISNQFLQRSFDVVGIIYFIYAPEVNRVKIGYTYKNLNKRFKSIQGQCSSKLILLGVQLGSIRNERELHERFKSFNSHCEWFDMSDEIANYIKKNTKPNQ